MTEAEISMVLDTYMYLNYTAPDGISLKEAVETIDPAVALNHPNEMKVIKQAVAYSGVGELIIVNQSRNMGFDEGTNAVTFRQPKEDKVFVAYRGTFDGEWLDNGNGLTEAESIQQRRANEYFDCVVENEVITKNDRVIITGHSKGANKAQFVTMNSKYGDRIDVCYSIDGQGHSRGAVEHWKEEYGPEEYAKRTSRIYGINGENDFVSVLGNCIIPASHIMYVRTEAECNDFVAYHDITRMFASLSQDNEGNSLITFNGRKNPYVFSRGELGDLVAGLSDDIMELPDEKLDGNASTLMQIAEVAMGGQKVGLNGERMHLDDLGDFASTGLGRILKRVFFTPEGASFLAKETAKEGLSRTYGMSDCLKVNYNKLMEEADRIEAASSVLGNMLLELEVTGLKLPFYLDGLVIRKADIHAEIAEMYVSKTRLIRRSEVLRTVAELYKNYDMSLNVS